MMAITQPFGDARVKFFSREILFRPGGRSLTQGANVTDGLNGPINPFSPPLTVLTTESIQIFNHEIRETHEIIIRKKHETSVCTTLNTWTVQQVSTAVCEFFRVFRLFRG